MSISKRIVLITVLLGTIAVSCKKEKEDISVSKNNNIGGSEVQYSNGIDRRLEECLINPPEGESGPPNKGNQCKDSFICSCPNYSECTTTPLAYLTEFTAGELEDWENGVPVFEYTRDFINDHYNFFMSMYDDSLGYHPDSIIAWNDL